MDFRAPCGNRARSFSARHGRCPDSYPGEHVRAVIVDDEAPARREMRRLLAEFDWITIVGEAAGIDGAQTLIEELTPALVFLDIQMPGGSGFDLLSRLEHVPRVIFTTAHDEHAVQAFAVNALDYLLKPIDPRRLAAALERVAAAAPTPAAPRAAILEQLFVQDGDRCWFVPMREVQLLTSEGNHVRLSWGKERPLLARSLTAVEQRLDPAQFFRANRRQIVNLSCIASVELGVGGRLQAQLRGGGEVEISRRQARVFKAFTTV
jgi:two-component system, LytTR family, response regulator